MTNHQWAYQLLWSKGAIQGLIEAFKSLKASSWQVWQMDRHLSSLIFSIGRGKAILFEHTADAIKFPIDGLRLLTEASDLMQNLLQQCCKGKNNEYIP